MAMAPSDELHWAKQAALSILELNHYFSFKTVHVSCVSPLCLHAHILAAVQHGG